MSDTGAQKKTIVLGVVDEVGTVQEVETEVQAKVEGEKTQAEPEQMELPFEEK